MKYIVMCIVALILCIGLGFGFTFLLQKLLKKSFRKPTKALIIVLADLGIIFLVMFLYLSDYYHGDDLAKQAMRGSSEVAVVQTSNGFLFDGPGKKDAMIFYPGAKVEAVAYAPVLLELAERGVDCFLVEMPFNMAIFNQNAAEEIMNRYTYETWTMAGHSMGGLVAANFAISHPELVQNVILLAAYSTERLPGNVRFLSVYGDRDGCLDMASYETGKGYWPAESAEVIISGGNHAQMGSYGFQSGDNEAAVSAEGQWEQVAEAIIDFLQK